MIRTFNPNHNSNSKKFHSFLDKIKSKELETCFQKEKVLLSTRQFPKLRKLLTTAKFERLPIPRIIKQVGFFPCADKQTASIITMIILKNVYLFCSNPKTNCYTIDTFLVVTVKLFYMYLFAITKAFLYWTN